MNEGRIQQLGTAHEIYYRPQREFVARFIGDNNILSGRLLRVEGERRQIETPIGKLWCSIDGQPELARLAEGEMALAVFRPEAISLASSGSDGENSAIGRVASINFAGAHTIADVIVDCTSGTDAPIKLRLRFPSRVDGAVIELGAKAKLHWRAEESRLVAS